MESRILTFLFAGLAACVADAPSGRADSATSALPPWQTAYATQIARGLEIAPAFLNRKGKDRDLVGLGSYIVNGVADCNGCHVSNPAMEYLPGHNPFDGKLPARVNPATYLVGGQSFGMVGPPPSPNIYARNLTTDSTGLPAGRTFEQFLAIMQKGTDLDHLHPNCSATVTTNCFPTAAHNPDHIPGLAPPYTDGNLLQVMAWPAFRHLTILELRAIYVYLSTVPCVPGGSPVQPPNQCPK